MLKTGTIYGINGPVIYLKGNTGFRMSEMVYVGEEKLVGEVIALDKDLTTVQVYEETTGLRPGETVTASGSAVSVTLAPGILNNIFDGIERPLERIADSSGGAFITRGVSVDSLDRQKKWPTHITVEKGQYLHGGDIIAEVPETHAITHKCMVPPEIEGIVTGVVSDGEYTIEETLVTLELPDGSTKELTMTQRWPIRVPRPTHHRFPASVPLITGQRIIDTMFPIAKGGTAAIPGGFGTGKTMTQHQIAKWADADIIIYIGCGERGNEMTQVLEEFGELTDPRTGNPLMDRTTLIANTSNMPVAAREASIYTGLTLAEYYRDMGYDVAIMADSTSRWAEALRELSGRLEEMPAEEGFPAYLASRLSAFYERAGMMHNLNGTDGSVTIIGAVSPQGGDFSEPVTQNTKRFVRCFWGLDKSLAYSRHFPAIHWLTSYSEYLTDLSHWYQDNVSPKFVDYRNRLMALLNQESSLLEIVKLIGSDVLPDDQKLVLEIARVIRLGFLQQNAFHKDDTCVSMEKQFLMMDTILYLFKQARALVTMGHPMSVLKSENIFDRVIAIKYDVPNDRPELFAQYHRDIDAFYQRVLEKNA
ncbi:MAG TPA: V-type ATP synthase subunit A [Candidatus Mediterraneibacter quadrami]|uniref:V-type ATP synthase alpha chain n=1 Tax=Candidatus Mediterraneibacter quadrami TaxID=2838684 RepID=A0A9D2RFK1_9FIRM|nr:V-type ATP synthase subunit A [Candidatus Mediterraneibacter quadrami]